MIMAIEARDSDARDYNVSQLTTTVSSLVVDVTTLQGQTGNLNQATYNYAIIDFDDTNYTLSEAECKVGILFFANAKSDNSSILTIPQAYEQLMPARVFMNCDYTTNGFTVYQESTDNDYDVINPRTFQSFDMLHIYAVGITFFPPTTM